MEIEHPIDVETTVGSNREDPDFDLDAVAEGDHGLVFLKDEDCFIYGRKNMYKSILSSQSSLDYMISILNSCIISKPRSF